MDIAKIGLLLHLKNSGNLIYYPVEDREFAVERLKELIQELYSMIENDKRVLETKHLLREKKLYEDELSVANKTLNYQ